MRSFCLFVFLTSLLLRPGCVVAGCGRRYARRLKLATLNITVLSDGRMDAFAPGSECAYYCFPGVPHHWAEMLLRMLEQQVYGVDGLGSAYL